MPHYTFELRDGSALLSDHTGAYLPDRECAFAYAKKVALELMQGREEASRSWRLDVYENRAERILELLFATLDPTLDHLRPERRRFVEWACDGRRSSREAVRAARATIREARALVARSRGKPYLAAIAGKQTIR